MIILMHILLQKEINSAKPDGAKRNKEVAFKNNEPFINCILKFNGVKIDNPEDLNVVMPMYNLFEYSKNYRKTTGSLWNSTKLNVPLIKCEVELILTWSKNCVLADMTTIDAEGDNPAIFTPTELEFKITDTKLYVPVVNLLKENYIKLLEQLKSGLKRTIKWNKYRSQMTIQPQNNNLNY